MKNDFLIHERVDRVIVPFWWVFYFEVMFVLLVLCCALAVGPVILAAYYPAWWSFLLLILIIPGWLGARFSIRYLRKLIWRNRHLNRYRMYAGHIHYRLYEEGSASPLEDMIPFQSVQAAYVSKYIANHHFAYIKTGFFKPQPYYHLLPIIYIQYNDGFATRILQVPLYENDEAELWLKHMHSKGIPLHLTPWLLAELPEEEKLKKLSGDEDRSIPYSVENSLEQQLQQLMQQEGGA